MTQPRKEQVTNPKTKYSRVDSAGSSILGNSKQQIIINATLNGDYTQFLNSTISKTPGGAESSSPALLKGGSGPYTLNSFTQFSISLPGVNNNLPIVIQFLTSDVITLSGSPVISVSRVASRINNILSTYGVIVPIASNNEGYLVLKSANTAGYTYGSNAAISLTDVTPGVLNIMGFTSSNFISTSGVDITTKGVITNSQDGLGGYVQIKTTNLDPSSPLNSRLVHCKDRVYAPLYALGKSPYGRITHVDGLEVNGRKFIIDFYRNGPTKPFVISSNSDFVNLNNTDNINIVMNLGNKGGVVNIPITFSSLTGVQDVLNVINNAWGSTTISKIKASVISPVNEVYDFTNGRDSFFISFNNNSTLVHIEPPTGSYSALEFSNYINNVISVAGIATEGQATTGNTVPGAGNRIVIQSLQNSGENSSVTFYPGNPGSSVPGNVLQTLDYLGFAVGKYSGTNIAEFYGNDEIKISNPSDDPLASMQITGSPTALAKLGLPTVPLTYTVLNTDEKVFVRQVNTLIPEILEFSQEPDNYDTVIENFDSENSSKKIPNLGGILNFGLDGLFGPDGKIDAGFIPTLLKRLNIESLNLNSPGDVDFGSQLIPKITSSNKEFVGPTLLWSGSSDLKNFSGKVRIYHWSSGIWITLNSYPLSYSYPSLTWTRDTSTDSYVFVISTNGSNFGIVESTAPSTWTSWPYVLESGVPTSNLEAIIKLGAAYNGSTKAPKPRLGFSLASGIKTLIASSSSSSSIPNIRLYMTLENNTTNFEITLNSRWTGTNWSKDITNQASTLFSITQDGFRYAVRNVGNNTSWTTWDSEPILYSFSYFSFYFSNAIRFPSFFPSEDPRILVEKLAADNARVLLLYSPTISGKDSIRVYLLNDGVYNSLEITVNAFWSNLAFEWTKDVTSRMSSCFSFNSLSNATNSTMRNKLPSVSSWSDFSWDNELNLNLYDSSKFHLISNQNLGVLAGNSSSYDHGSIYRSSYAKSWGVIAVAPNGSITHVTGLNCSSSTPTYVVTPITPTTRTITVYFEKNMLNTIAYSLLLSVSEKSLSLYHVKTVGQSLDSFEFAIYDASGNIVPNATEITVNYLVFSRS